MKFNIIFIFIFLTSCTTNVTKLENRSPYNSKGFAYIYNDQDYETKIISSKLDNSKEQVSVYNLKINSLIKIINPNTKESLTINNYKRIQYPDFYKILITEKVAEKLSLDPKLPLVELIEIKKNKSFVAEKAEIFNEEKKISSNAPVTSVQISNISKNNPSKKNIENEFYIVIGTFFSFETAEFLIKRIKKEIPIYDIKKLKIVKKSNKEIRLLSGPYNSINLMKNDYIYLKNFGFEELDISTDE
tara:strand:+ start:394 stop:1128 length:735 start_codon:yes stop_codon:yes gene_type:complete